MIERLSLFRILSAYLERTHHSKETMFSGLLLFSVDARTRLHSLALSWRTKTVVRCISQQVSTFAVFRRVSRAELGLSLSSAVHGKIQKLREAQYFYSTLEECAGQSIGAPPHFKPPWQYFANKTFYNFSRVYDPTWITIPNIYGNYMP
jgi:hypothetical protein